MTPARSRRLPAFGTAIALLVAGVLAATAPGGAAAAGPVKPALTAAKKAGARPAFADKFRRTAVLHTRKGQFVTVGPDPRLAETPGTPDILGWRRKWAEERAATQQAQKTAGAKALSTRKAATAKPPTGKNRLSVTENEPAGTNGENDSPATAQKITGFGTRKPAKNAADVSGVLSPGPLPDTFEPIPPNVEDDDSFDTAGVTGVSTDRQGATTTGTIGDNPPNPDLPGLLDEDLYALDLTRGQLVTATATATSGDLLPVMGLFSEDGRFLGDSFDTAGETVATLTGGAPADGRYFLAVIGLILFDDTTGTETDTKGDYKLDIGARQGDVDTYAVNLRGGDVLGVSVAGAARTVSVSDTAGTELMGSSQDATFIMPPETPLPGGGNAMADVVAPRKGTYYVTVLGIEGDYSATVEAYRPGGTGRRAQTIYLDFDGQRLNTGVWGGRGVTTLSPLKAFLPAWGLKNSDLPALKRKIKATVVENLRRDLQRSGLSNSVSVNVVTSDEVKDPWGKPGVMRLIVGGTIDESGIFTIGIANVIDPGNFLREDQALVLLDVLSEPSEFGNPDSPASLNTYLGPNSNRVAFVGQAVGNVTSHEAGHLLGNWHTDNSDGVDNLMDAGGFGFDHLFGVGADGEGGTADDADVDFVTDTYDLFEGFTGQENTTAKTTWALSR